MKIGFSIPPVKYGWKWLSARTLVLANACAGCHHSQPQATPQHVYNRSPDSETRKRILIVKHNVPERISHIARATSMTKVTLHLFLLTMKGVGQQTAGHKQNSESDLPVPVSLLFSGPLRRTWKVQLYDGPIALLFPRNTFWSAQHFLIRATLSYARNTFFHCTTLFFL
jgi:hypothetical protein